MKKIYIWSAILLMTGSCMQKKSETVLSNEQEISLSGQLHISSDPQLEKVLDVWIREFSSSYADIEIKTGTEGYQLFLHAENVPADFDIDEYWKVTVMREGIIPVMSAKNPFKEAILKNGIKKSMLVKAFTEGMGWGEIPGITSAEMINIYLPPQGNVVHKRWSDYLDIPVEDLNGRFVENKQEFLSLMDSDPFAIGVMSACCVYDAETQKPIPGIMALPIDFNENGRIDEKESFYEDLCRLERSYYLGVLPFELCTEIYLVSKTRPSDPVQVEFIRWVLTRGQKFAEQEGYARIRSYTAEEILKTLNQ